jgi:hypothetical protein
MNSNPIQLVQILEKTLKRYIPTTLGISHNYPVLRQKFIDLVREQRLIRGPYVEALPDFEKGTSLKKLLRQSGGYLHDGFADISDVLLNRPLHLHQEEALKRSCRDRESLLVATGTGSGKTETFLFPIAHQLLDDPEPFKPGVRVLLIYPMNALANDQLLYRIAPLFGKDLKRHNITFGRYTSQIKAHASQEDEEAKILENARLMNMLGGEIPSNWLLTREAMLVDPPKVLLTNYAMLEHLLLLPRNAPLFAHPTLQSVVLDEIHTYSGAQAAEVAFLLRKLKNRLGIKHRVQVFGTSASLREGEGADKKLLHFASTLFGEQVDAVIRGKREIHIALRENEAQKTSLSIQEWIQLGRIAADICDQEEEEDRCEKWNSQIEEKKLVGLSVDETLPLGHELLRLFKGNSQVRAVAKALSDGQVLSFMNLAETIFSGHDLAEAQQALAAVIHIGMLARENENDFPLLPGRYHIATNGIEGVAIALDADSSESWKGLRCTSPGYDENGHPMYPLMVCRRCGQPFVEGFTVGSFFFPTNETGSANRKVFWLGTPKTTTLDESDEESQDTVDEGNVFSLDPVTCKLAASEETGVPMHEVTTQEDTFERRMYVKRCPACGTQASGGMAEVITHMHPGNEAMGAVICQQLMNFLPPDSENSTQLPMGGRSLLTFSDNRQDAAFFAPYFERTANDLALRSAAFQVLHKYQDEGFDFDDLAREILKLWKKTSKPIIIDGTGQSSAKDRVQRSTLSGLLAAEFCTPGGRRTSLEALGVASIEYEEESFKRFVKEIRGLLPENYRKDSKPMALLLLEQIRREKAISAPSDGDVDMTDEAIWGKAYCQHRSFESVRTTNSRITHAWSLPPDAVRHNRRTWFLQKQLGWSRNETLDFLTGAWEAMRKSKLLLRLNPGFGLDVLKIHVRYGAESPLFRCVRCGLTSHYHIDSKCPAFRCSGHMVEIDRGEMSSRRINDHYVAMLNSGATQTLRAREHTASLSQEIRQEIEQEFSEKNINLLSCTTTMEMGVDLGDLEAVACLNIPPGISNYQQRTGRAGRRAQAAPLCVTLAKNSRYDQSVFEDFRGYLDTPAHIQHIHLANAQLFQRHQFSILLSGFLRHRIQDTSVNAPRLHHFFAEKHDDEGHQQFMDDLYRWLESAEGKACTDEAERLQKLLPPDHMGVGLIGQALTKSFSKTLERFSRLTLERWSTLNKKVQEYAENKQHQNAANWERQLKKYMGQFLVNRLSFQGVIPTYSFPVHSLSLEVIKEQKGASYFDRSDVELSRDASLGISEYAPGCRVVANGRIWTSAGLAYSPNQFMPVQVYKACPECNHVEVGLEKNDLAAECPFCGNPKRGFSINYIEPVGFVTDYAERRGGKPGQVRPRRMYADEARLISQARENVFHITDHPAIRRALLPALSKNKMESGRLFIVNKGPNGMGFHRCDFCNRMEPAKKLSKLKVKHNDIRTGVKCRSEWMSYPVCLAHEFSTDIAIIQITTQLPVQANSQHEQGDFVNHIATTLSEAFRFAATDLLNIQDSEIRSSFKLRDMRADIILYDNVPGGAGYAKQLQDVSMRKLLKRAIRLLECPSKCSTACRNCLCDYSNQTRWPKFKRKPVLEWLNSLIDRSSSSLISGAIPWPESSLSGLSSRLEGYDTIHITGSSLFGSEATPEDEGMIWLLNHLTEGKKVFCHLSVTPPYRPANLRSSERRCWTRLRDFIEQEQLILTYMPKNDLPRVFAEPSLGAPAFYTENVKGPILDNPLPGPAALAIMDEPIVKSINEQLKIVTKHPSSVTDEQKPRVINLASGQPRIIRDIFSPLKGAFVEELTVKDPYCGAKRNIPSTTNFMKELQKLPSECKKVAVVCKEESYGSNSYTSPQEIYKNLQNQLSPLYASEQLKIIVRDFIRSRKFHDRSIIAKVITSDGETNTHRFDLSGGIDHLLDDRRDTKIYYYLQE